VVNKEKIPLLVNCGLESEEKGVYLKNSGKVKNNFRVRRELEEWDARCARGGR
jgi:hypothetical protein